MEDGRWKMEEIDGIPFTSLIKQKQPLYFYLYFKKKLLYNFLGCWKLFFHLGVSVVKNGDGRIELNKLVENEFEPIKITR